MSSYDSHHSGTFHPNYHPQAAPPYPTTPGPAQNSAFYPPPQQSQSQYQQHQQFFSTSPTSSRPIRDRRSSSSSYHRPSYEHSRPSIAIPIRQPQASDFQSSSPTYNNNYAHAYSSSAPQAQPSSSYPPQHAPFPGPAPAQPQPIFALAAPVYARTLSSASHYARENPHAYGDGEVRHDNNGAGSRGGGGGEMMWGLDEDTEREYEERYAREKARERETERRPTLGESVVSAVGKLGSVFGSRRR